MDILTKVQDAMALYNPKAFTGKHVQHVLQKNYIDIQDFGILLSPAAEPFIEQMAARAKVLTARHFGNAISLFTPLYLSNYCQNHCTYCGFALNKTIRRGKLTLEEVEKELKSIAKTGLDEILLLCGEDRTYSDINYLGEAVKLSAKLFNAVGIEIYPLEQDEYTYLHKCGADFVSLYQETYDKEVYRQVHPEGPKSLYDYRFNTQERALLGGMRGVSIGSLLGIAEFRADTLATGLHAYYLQQKYPHGEFSFSVPRIRGNTEVSERQLLQVMLALRIFMPYAGITISTRERANFRDNVVGMCATKMSAGVLVGVGGHELEQKGDEQFAVSDPRSVQDIHKALLDRGLQPVYTDYVRVN